jgi:hypothetical protein
MAGRSVDGRWAVRDDQCQCRSYRGGIIMASSSAWQTRAAGVLGLSRVLGLVQDRPRLRLDPLL